jgi:glycosyltransferase involved in cell wall biosynthesis
MPEISVVAPAFNQVATIEHTLGEILARLDRSGLDFELIVVSDGSTDGTYDAARRVEDPRLRVLDYDRNLGKGFALRTGSLAASGDWVAWIDSDLDLDPGRLAEFLTRARADRLDVLVGSKRHPDSMVSYPGRRRFYSWLYQMLVRALFSLDVRDTQVGMKLFRREVLDRVLPVVLVKRYAFDLEILAVSRHFGFGRIAEAPITLDYQFSGSGVNWRAIANALWDTAAVFYRLRLRRYYDRERRLARRAGEWRESAPRSLAVVTAPARLDDDSATWLSSLARVLPDEGEVIVVTERSAAGAVPPIDRVSVVQSDDRRQAGRLRRGVEMADADIVALVAPGARPSGGWAGSAMSLFGDPSVGVVVGPAVPRLGGEPARDAAGILAESRLGVGSARVRAHVGRMQELDGYPLTNVFVRRPALQTALEEGDPLDDELCAALGTRTGLATVFSPDVIVTTRPRRLFGPYLRGIYGLGLERGARAAGRRLLRPRYGAPLLLMAVALLAPAALVAGGAFAIAWGAVMALYAAGLLGLAATTFLLHRRLRLAAMVAVGAAASHLAFGAGLLRGLARRRRGGAAAAELEAASPTG